MRVLVRRALFRGHQEVMRATFRLLVLAGLLGCPWVHAETPANPDLREALDILRAPASPPPATRGFFTTDASFAETKYQEGRTAMKAGRLAVACTRFAEAIKLAPDVARYHYSMGFSLTRRGLYDQAESELSRALVLQPDYVEASKALTYVRQAIQARGAEMVGDELNRAQHNH